MATKNITIDQAAAIISTADESHLLLELQLYKAGFRIMHYYGEKILAHKKQIEAFCMDGMFSCEGCERDHFIDLLCGLETPHFHIYDCYGSEIDSYIDFSDTVKTLDAWMLEGEMRYA